MTRHNDVLATWVSEDGFQHAACRKKGAVLDAQCCLVNAGRYLRHKADEALPICGTIYKIDLTLYKTGVVIYGFVETQRALRRGRPADRICASSRRSGASQHLLGIAEC